MNAFPKVQPREVGIRTTLQSDEGGPCGETDAGHRAALLEEQAAWTARKFPERALQILLPIRQVGIGDEAVRHEVVRGLVALDAHRGLGEIHRERESAVDRTDNQGRQTARQHPRREQGRRVHGPGRPHASTRAVRNARSSVPFALRRVARDCACRMSYSRSIFFTNASMSYWRAVTSAARPSDAR